MSTTLTLLVAALVAAANPLPSAGEEMDVTAAAVTALSCATRARDQGNLGALTGCAYAEAQREIVVYDVAEKLVYRLQGKLVQRWQLEGAFGGGSVDFVGRVRGVDKKTGVVTVEVAEWTVTPKPKAGSFKGCL